MLALNVKPAMFRTVKDIGKSYKYCANGLVVIASLHLNSKTIPIVDETVQLYNKSPPGQAGALTVLSTNELSAASVKPIDQAKDHVNYNQVSLGLT